MRSTPVDINKQTPSFEEPEPESSVFGNQGETTGINFDLHKLLGEHLNMGGDIDKEDKYRK